ncbi:hypothetical protein DPEC_G00179980 [Dallia pectoralis]|uniref:Uncharacterized protein n=1 Tax=Dallia pectoralis TaxID=75939 RepID=A0ACC2G9X2_DALPE|nr:hypothetical protein DPEC_G00179980 [Dallia pectoralis]
MNALPASQRPTPDIILRCHNDFLTNLKAAWDSDSEGEGVADGVRRVPDLDRDDLASRRNPRPHTAPRMHQYIPDQTCSQRDRQVWENIRKASHRALVEKMAVEKMEVEKMEVEKMKMEVEKMKMERTSHMGGVIASQNQSLEANPCILSCKTPLLECKKGEADAKVPDPQRDDILNRSTIATASTFTRFLPMPSTQCPALEVVIDRKLQQPKYSVGTPQKHSNMAKVVRSPVPRNDSYDDGDEEGPVPDLKKDDMLARRTRAYQRSVGGNRHSFNLFLPVPGAAQHWTTPTSGANQLLERKLKQKQTGV